MKAPGVLLLAILLIGPFSGCFGGPPAVASTEAKYKPYTNWFRVPANGLEAREPACAPEGGCSEYFFVTIYGSENATILDGPDVIKPCTKPWLYDAYPNNQTLIYNKTRYTRLESPDLYTVVGENFWGITFNNVNALQGCPTGYGLWDYAKKGVQTHKHLIGSFGLLDLRMYRGGNMTLLCGQDCFHLFDIGEKLVVSYGRLRTVGESSYFVQGGFEIANLGPWPIDQLQPGVGSVRPQG